MSSLQRRAWYATGICEGDSHAHCRVAAATVSTLRSVVPPISQRLRRALPSRAAEPRSRSVNQCILYIERRVRARAATPERARQQPLSGRGGMPQTTLIFLAGCGCSRGQGATCKKSPFFNATVLTIWGTLT